VLTFPMILTIIFTAAGVMLAVILVVVVLPRSGRNGRRRSGPYGPMGSEEVSRLNGQTPRPPTDDRTAQGNP
jgi:hypothetical protein